MKKKMPAWVILLLITLISGLLLGITDYVTRDKIAEAAIQAANESRIAVSPGADSFKELVVSNSDSVDNYYSAYNGQELIGYTSQTTVQGYGGEIEVIVGMNLKGVITGISVGGPNFAETAGLGADTKKPEFRDQFIGKTVPLVLKDNIDSVSGASISSGAVTDAVNICVNYMIKKAGI